MWLLSYWNTKWLTVNFQWQLDLLFPGVCSPYQIVQLPSSHNSSFVYAYKSCSFNSHNLGVLVNLSHSWTSFVPPLCCWQRKNFSIGSWRSLWLRIDVTPKKRKRQGTSSRKDIAGMGKDFVSSLVSRFMLYLVLRKFHGWASSSFFSWNQIDSAHSFSHFSKFGRNSFWIHCRESSLWEEDIFSVFYVMIIYTCTFNWKSLEEW